MPTFNQLVRKGRQTSEKKSTAPALQKGWNSLQKRATDAVSYTHQMCIRDRYYIWGKLKEVLFVPNKQKGKRLCKIFVKNMYG